MADGSSSEGWITFTALILGVEGVVNAIVGVLAMYNLGPFGGERAAVNTYGWGIMLLFFGVASIVAALLISRRSNIGRMGGILLAAASLIMWSLWLGAYTTAALIAVVLDILVLFGLSVSKERFT